MKKLWNDFIHLFFPNLCVICDTPLIHAEEQICLSCLCDLPHTNFHKREENPVMQLFFGKVYITEATSFLLFEKKGKTQKLIHALKYHGNKELAYQLGRMSFLELKTAEIYQTVDVIVPVPLHRKREKHRGYNQSEYIAKGIHSVTHIPVCTDLLKRKNENRSQVGKGVFERWENVKEIFYLQEKEEFKGKHILLVDDVITTGSTICACAEVLQTLPGTKVSVFSLAKA